MIEIIFLIGVLGGLYLLSLHDNGFTPPKTAPSNARIYAAFESAESLFVNRAELAFFHTLRRALPPDYHLHCKVRLEDIVRVKKSGHRQGAVAFTRAGEITPCRLSYHRRAGRASRGNRA